MPPTSSSTASASTTARNRREVETSQESMIHHCRDRSASLCKTHFLPEQFGGALGHDLRAFRGAGGENGVVGRDINHFHSPPHILLRGNDFVNPPRAADVVN